MIYDYPEYCEVFFSSRDIDSEIDFICEVVRRYSRIPVTSVLDICSGNALHTEALVNRGFRYTGLDSNDHMLDYCRTRWQALGSDVRWHKGDMCDFDLSEPVDFAFVMVGSLIYITDDESYRGHFNSIARNLKPGGLYLLDACVQFHRPEHQQVSDVVQEDANGIRIESNYHTRLIDSVHQVYSEDWHFAINDRGISKTIEGTEKTRAVFPQEFLMFIEHHPDFEFVDWWDGWDLSRPIKHQSRVDRPVALIRRR